MFAFAERLLLNFRQLRELSPQQRREAIKRRLGPRLVGRIGRFRANREQRRLRRIEEHQGMAAAHRELWLHTVEKRGWVAVRDRVAVLEQNNSAEIDALVAVGLELTGNPLVLVSMAQHPLTAPALARALAAERADPQPQIAARMAGRADYAAAFLVATALTGDDAAMDHARARIPDVVGEPFLQFIESFGQRPAAEPSEIEPLLRGLRHNGLRTPKRHRLVIAQNFSNPATFLPLLCGAEKVTLLGLDDTFGKAVFAEFQDYPGMGEIVVEHIRSRITRFSPQYIEAHTQTRDAAIELAAIVDSVPGLVPAGDLPHIELAIADHLFFQLLRLRAVQELLTDPDFDHIVVATNGQAPASGFILTLSGASELLRDPRVELMSLAHSVNQRTAFSAILPAILTGLRPGQIAENWLPPASELAAQLWRNAHAMAASLPDRPMPDRSSAGAEADRKSVMVATTSNAAYDYSTARYAAALSRDFTTAFAVCGGTAAKIHSELTNADVGAGVIPFHLLRREYLPGNTSFSRWLAGQINLFCARRGPQDGVAHVISCAPGRLVTNIIQSQILHGQVLESWFARMAKAGGLPDAITLSAGRTASVSQFAAAARRHGVPTLMLEAHGLNANYCRYAKVGADYYGVIAEKFRRDAEWGFAIGQDRTRTVGTPRIIARPGRSHEEARAEIATQLGSDFPLRPGGAISFFSQPSSWAHIDGVWRLILAAAQELDLQVLLKPHPEETASRVGQYNAVAREMQLEDRVQLLTTNPSVLIEASDVVLTGYSTAALDAAAMGRPVVCVTVGDAAYPLEQHEIARAPLAYDLNSLCNALRPLLDNPDAAAETYAAFLQAEPQFAEGPDERLRGFMAEIVAKPEIRSSSETPSHLFLDPPHPTFAI